METSNFGKSGKLPNAVAISIGTPRFWKGKRYRPLAPTREMLAMNEDDYATHYQKILDGLDPQKVYDDLVALAGENPVLLCWEAFNDRCHRRWVAEWLEASLGLIIPELGYPRGESLPFAAQKRAEKTAKPAVKKEKKAAAGKNADSPQSQLSL